MTILIPGFQNANPFFEEIIPYSNHNFISRDYREFATIDYQGVLIHWPELLFSWSSPTQSEIKELERALKYWKNYKTIFYLVHNLKPHQTDLGFQKIYRKIEFYCEVMIHFGSYSRDYYQKIYPNKVHSIILHPTFKKSYKVIEKNEARFKLGIAQDAKVIIAPGQIRSLQERKLVLDGFKSLPLKNKVLLVPKMRKKTIEKEFRGKHFLKPVIDIKKIYEKIANNIYRKPKFLFNYSHIPPKRLSLLMAASDVVLIPRVETLNSGVLFLGLTYKKVITGPGTGNVKEILERCGFPIFDPFDSKSVSGALATACKLSAPGNYKFEENLLLLFDPAVIAQEWDLLINKHVIIC